MRVLMFGWEFPPHISGGLGTASYGLTKGMTAMKDMEVIFVVPKAWGDEDQTSVRLIGANKVPVTFRDVYYKGFRKSIEKIEVSSKIVPYTDPEEFWRLTRSEVSGYKMFVNTNDEGTVDFSGRYDSNLMDEIHKYSVVGLILQVLPQWRYRANHLLYMCMRLILIAAEGALIPMFTGSKRGGWTLHQRSLRYPTLPAIL